MNDSRNSKAIMDKLNWDLPARPQAGNLLFGIKAQRLNYINLQ